MRLPEQRGYSAYFLPDFTFLLCCMGDIAAVFQWRVEEFFARETHMIRIGQHELFPLSGWQTLIHKFSFGRFNAQAHGFSLIFERHMPILSTRYTKKRYVDSFHGARCHLRHRGWGKRNRCLDTGIGLTSALGLA